VECDGEGFDECGDSGFDCGVERVDAFGRDDHELGEAARAMDARDPEFGADRIPSGLAGRTRTTGVEGLDDDSEPERQIAFVSAPLGESSELVDASRDFVAGDQSARPAALAMGVKIAATEAAGIHPHPDFVRAAFRDRKGGRRDGAVCRNDRGTHLLGRVDSRRGTGVRRV
jgi:hypothetical protein